MYELFGRAREIGAIERFLAELPAECRISTGAAALLIQGDAGIGKSSLWRAATSMAGRAGYTVLTARCAEAEAKLSFAALGDLLEPVAEEILATLPPPLGRALDVALLRADAGAAVTDWRAVGLGVLGVIRQTAALAPVLVAIDDLQWLDGSTARVLSFALRRLAADPVGLIATERSGPITGSEGSARRPGPEIPIVESGGLAVLEVGQLGPEFVERAVRSRLGSALSDVQMADVVRTAAGNPFFAVELAMAAAAPRRQSSSAGADVTAMPVPAAIAALLQRQLARMPSDARELIAMTAMVTAPTTHLAGLLMGDQARAAAAIEAGVAAGVLTVEGTRIRLMHPLLGTAVSQELPAAQRQVIHRRLAELVDDEEERAGHLASGAAGPDADVAAALDRAATRARRRGAPDAAASLAERAVALTPVTDRADRCRRLVVAGEFRWQVGAMATARLLLEEAIGSIGAGQLRARAMLCLGRILFDFDVTASVAATTEALDTSGDDSRLRAQALIDMAFAINDTADRGQARPHSEEAARLAASLDDADMSAQALSVLALCLTIDGEPAAERTLARALSLEERVPYLSPARGPALVAGLRAVWSGDCDAARKQIGEVLQRALDWGEHSSVPDLLVSLAQAETQAGDWAAAAEHALSAQRLAGAEGHVRVQASALGAVATVAALRGDERTCLAAAESGLDLSAQAGSIAGVVGCTAAVGLMYLGQGDFAGTDRQLGGLCDTFVIASYEPSVIAFVADEIEALTGLGKLAEAAAMLGQYETRARQLASRPALAAALRCRALLASVSGDLPAALAAADEAMALQVTMAQPFGLARTQLARGSVLRRARRWGEARLALDAAIAGFDALGAAAWTAQARQQRERLGGRQPGRQHLTATEAQVVRLAAAGRTNREIAAELYVSVRAVEKTLTGSYRKLGVRSRTELAVRLARDPGSGGG